MDTYSFGVMDFIPVDSAIIQISIEQSPIPSISVTHPIYTYGILYIHGSPTPGPILSYDIPAPIYTMAPPQLSISVIISPAPTKKPIRKTPIPKQPIKSKTTKAKAPVRVDSTLLVQPPAPNQLIIYINQPQFLESVLCFGFIPKSPVTKRSLGRTEQQDDAIRRHDALEFEAIAIFITGVPKVLWHRARSTAYSDRPIYKAPDTTETRPLFDNFFVIAYYLLRQSVYPNISYHENG